MTGAEWVVIIGTAGLWLERIIARVQAGPLRDKVITAIADVKDTAVEIKEQTNGASLKLQQTICDQSAEIARLQGMVQQRRAGGRRDDLPPAA